MIPRLACLAMLVTIAACASGPPDTVQVTLTGDPALNPGPDRKAVPTQVRLYLLGRTEKFNGADYFQLYGKEADVLGADLIARDEETVRPGETRTVPLAARGAKYLGIAVSYRAIDTATWRAVVPTASRVQVTLGANAVSAR